ncbi:MAG: hypothetical protein JW797_08025 [Bradymonadales bacterium]|nr:hypothetical protein [Bradymonadales bacterium]
MRTHLHESLVLALFVAWMTILGGCGSDDDGPSGQADLTDLVFDADVSPGDVTHDAEMMDLVVADNRIGDWDYLIVTTDALRPAFETLADWRRQTGLPTRVVTMQEVTQAATGRDTAEQLRNYLKAMWEEQGVQIVLLGGDTPLVPHRDVYAYAEIEGIFETAAITPSELYFSDLDGDWDGDEDGAFGEFEDDLEMMPDIAVGRVPARSLQEAEGYVAKVLAYEQAEQADYQHKVLYLAEPTGWADLSPCPMFELWTGQLFGEVHEIHRLYDDLEQCPNGEQNTRTSQMAAINEGMGMIIHLGHGSEGTLAYMNASQVDSLANAPRYNLMFSCACLTGNFGWSEAQSAGEHYVIDPDGGGVAYVGNTDIGIGFPPGGFFVKEVVAQLLRDPPVRLGQAFANSRRSFIVGGSHSWTDGHADRYTQFVVVLLGDPGIRMFRQMPRPLELELPDPFPAAGELAVSVTDEDGEPVSAATVTLFRAGQLLLLQPTDDFGQATFDISGTPSGNLTVTASGPDLIPVQATVVVP